MATCANNFIVFDLETGGLDPKTSPIMEFGCICFDPNDLSEIFRESFYIKNYAGLQYDQKALDANGIKLDFLMANGLDPKVAHEKTVALLKLANPSGKANSKPIMCGHNITEFDLYKSSGELSHFQYFFKHHKDSLDKYISGCIDTLPLAKFMWPNDDILKNYKLVSCSERINHEHGDAHTSMGDVEVNFELMKAIAIKLRDSDSGEAVGGGFVPKKFRHSFQF